MPLDTAAQLKLPPKVSGQFRLKVSAADSSSPSSSSRSTYSGEYSLELRDPAGERILGSWTGTLSGEEEGTPSEVTDRVYTRLAGGSEIFRTIVTPRQPRITP